MAFRKVKGLTRREWLTVTASTALAKGTLVEFTSGKLAAADADETGDATVGVLDKTIAATDADYAVVRKVPVLIPVERHVLWEADASGFTADNTQEGVEYGISDSGTVDYTETTAKLFKVTQVLSATKVRGYLKINGSY